MFGSIMSDMERDPIFGAHHRAMNRMMGGFFGGQPMFGGPAPFNNQLLPWQQQTPMAFPPMGGLFGGGFPGSVMAQAQPGLFYSSSSVTSITSGGPDGRPHVYQASSSTRQAPGGVKETRKTVTDSRSGTKKMEVGRHLGGRGYVKERQDNLYTGQREENEEFINLAEEEATTFDHEWKRAATGGSTPPSIGLPGYDHTPGVTIEELPPSDDEDMAPPPTPRPPRPRRLNKKLKRAKKY